MNMVSSGTTKKFSQWPWATIGLIALNIIVYTWQQYAKSFGLEGHVIKDYGFSSLEFRAHPFLEAPRLISHTFLHADPVHLIGNLIFYFLFAPAVERVMGSLLFIVGYFFWGVMGALSIAFFAPFAGGIGSSGAGSGIVGAFFVLYPLKMPPNFLSRFLGHWVNQIPAFLYIGFYYFIMELHEGYKYLLTSDPALQVTMGGVGHWAHVGGFAAGALTMLPFVFTGSRKKEPSR